MKRIMYLSIIPLMVTSLIFINCTSSCNKTKIIKIDNEEGVKKNDISTLAPGQVVLQATVIDINRSDSKTYISILVNKVIEYGSTTTPIANGSNLTVPVREQTKTEHIQNTDTIIVVMQNRPTEPGNEGNANWEILRFK